MSPEINGNPPTAAKRKKNREKKTASATKLNSFDLNMPNSNYLFNNPNNMHNNLSIPDLSAYCSFLGYSTPTEPMSLPIYPMNYPNYTYPNTNMNYLNPNATKPSMLHNNAGSFNSETNEYLSLPIVNMDQNEEESSKRRFSDPGVPNDSDSSSNSTIEDKIIQKLTQQVNVLKESNRKLSRDVMDLRLEVNMLKQQQGVRHYEREYEPGMVTDLIREVRDAARVREDALLARVRHMIEEKQVSLGHVHMVSEKNRHNERISKLEEQLKNLTVNHSSRSDENVFQSSTNEDAGISARQVLELEREALELRRELQDTRAKKEEADKKLQQLDRKLASILRRNDLLNSETSEDGKTSTDTMSISTTSTLPQTSTPRVTLTGPVTDL